MQIVVLSKLNYSHTSYILVISNFIQTLQFLRFCTHNIDFDSWRKPPSSMYMCKNIYWNFQFDIKLVFQIYYDKACIYYAQLRLDIKLVFMASTLWLVSWINVTFLPHLMLCIWLQRVSSVTQLCGFEYLISLLEAS